MKNIVGNNKPKKWNGLSAKGIKKSILRCNVTELNGYMANFVAVEGLFFINRLIDIFVQ